MLHISIVSRQGVSVDAAGAQFGAAYAVGWFDDLAQMRQVAREYHGVSQIHLDAGKVVLR